jgi:DNA-binding MarR family transcriptional regulator
MRADATMARRHGIHATDIASLNLIHSLSSPITPSALAKHLGISTGSATAAIDRLERAGFVTRQANPSDRRGVIVTPTNNRGKELLEILRQVNLRYAATIGAFSSNELAIVERFMSSLVNAR